jgi:tetratricopeptide (TPR) repeat protein
MLGFSRRLIYTFSNKIRRKVPEGNSAEKLIVDFSRTKNSLFDIKSESSYNAYLSNGSLVLGLKKSNCIAWVEIPELEYRDHSVKAKIRLDNLGGYASTGIIFRLEDQDSYYLALVSSKGYFRLDVVKDSAPKALVAWTEISDFDGINIDLELITYGTYLIFIVNGKWVGEINDDSITSGRLGFALASYESEADSQNNEYTCKAWLDHFVVDARISTIEEKYANWNEDSNINAEGRLRLAETFAVMGKSSKALEQITRAWRRRDEAISAMSVSYTEVRTKKELLLAARMAINLDQYDEAEEYIDLLLDQWGSTAEGKLAHTEKIKILNEKNKFAELKDFAAKHSDIIDKDIGYYSILERCYWELKEYNEAAEACVTAFRMNSENGVYAVNAANALNLMEKKEEALLLFLEAGRLFLKQDNKGELEAMIPKLSSLGEKNWEARVLAGKWAFSVEEYDRCEAEFATANKLRNALKPRPKGDPAHFYLWGITLSLRGRNSDAVRLLERAVKLAPAYGLFRFKLAELKLANGVKDPKLADELKLALEDMGEDSNGTMAHHAGNLLLNAGDRANAQYFFEKALTSKNESN